MQLYIWQKYVRLIYYSIILLVQDKLGLKS